MPSPAARPIPWPCIAGHPPAHTARRGSCPRRCTPPASRSAPPRNSRIPRSAAGVPPPWPAGRSPAPAPAGAGAAPRRSTCSRYISSFRPPPARWSGRTVPWIRGSRYSWPYIGPGTPRHRAQPPPSGTQGSGCCPPASPLQDTRRYWRCSTGHPWAADSSAARSRPAFFRGRYGCSSAPPSHQNTVSGRRSAPRRAGSRSHPAAVPAAPVAFLRLLCRRRCSGPAPPRRNSRRRW